MSRILDVHEVTKSFGKNRVLEGVSLEMEEHSVVCLIGASGSGKSTLLRCINGLEPIDSGTIVVNGRQVVQDEPTLNRLRREVGMVFQSFNLFPHMTVMENVTLAPRQVLRLPAEQAKARAEELLERIGLTDKCDDYPDRLSGGQQQRVAIVRALAMQPKLMLLDEITSALDPALVGEVLDLVRDLVEEGMTLLLATHEMGFARQVASQICFLHDGRIVEHGLPEQIFTDPAAPETRQFLKRVLASGRL
ncbi:MAG TPA: amino acid ABC transporter ATP-binding protein [Actinomycetota bacterium]|nr:amino acid ABC transporter ATP-binding protein [Actinomycetota bacterium]